MFQGAGPTLDAAILYCLENGNVEGCRALLQPLYERNQFSSVIAQQTLCLHLENLLQKRSRSEPRARQQRLLNIRNSFRLSNMWRVVEALLEEMTVEEDDEPSEMEASRQMDQYIRELRRPGTEPAERRHPYGMVLFLHLPLLQAGQRRELHSLRYQSAH